MSDMEISKVLTQMRALAGSLELPPPTPEGGSGNFGALLRSAIDDVSRQQQVASTMVREFETGVSTASVAEVMVTMQKGSLAFTAMTQVRNRLVEAYQEIMNMPI